MKSFLIFSCFFIFYSSLIGQSYWKEVKSLNHLERSAKAIEYIPAQYRAVSIDFDGLKEKLTDVSEEFSSERNITTITLPLPDGTEKMFSVSSTKTMEEGLAIKYPSIKSYKGWSEDGRYIVRFDLSPYGMRAAMRTPQGEVYIDPYLKNDQEYHLVYYTKNHTEPSEAMGKCGFKNESAVRFGDKKLTANNRTVKLDLHEYRLALACTGEWGKTRGTKELALADMNTSVNRLNLIFENEFASRFVLITENDKLIHLDGANDPYTMANNGGNLLGQNTQVINNILGSVNAYDIGHVYTNSCTDVGGVAFFSICALNRGGGVTCHYSNLIYITVQVAAHEIGHQMSASHTFNACQEDSQNAGERGFEPGSGSTIMAYGNLCGSNNVGGVNQDYYHNGSLGQIYNELREPFGIAYGCAKKISINNDAPVAKILSPKAGLIVPKSTPFILDGKGDDVNNDKLTYNWEQKDGSVTLCPLGQPSGNCPLFRSVKPDTFPYRVFPSGSLILSDQNSMTEVLPSYSREMNFSFTVRDNNKNGGYANWDNLKMKADGDSGPFRVTFPSEGGVVVNGGSKFKVTWDVNGTDKGLVNAKFVNIYVSRKDALHSTDQNLKLLAADVPNNGSAIIQMDNIASTDTRILIKPSNGVWFNISRVRFEVKTTSIPKALINIPSAYYQVCTPQATDVTINSSALNGYAGNVNYKVVSLVPGITAVFSKNSEKVGSPVSLKISPSEELKTGFYEVPIQIIVEGVDTILRSIYLDVTSTSFKDLASKLPLNGEKDAELPTFTWTKAFNAINYTLQVSKSPTFADLSLTNTTLDTFFKPAKTFDKKSIYYWRIRANNSCGNGPWSSIKSFGTLTQDCRTYEVAAGLPINISTGGASTVSARINVPTGKNISDVNVSKLKIRHDNFKDLTGTLISPDNKKVIIWDNICEKILNIEVLVDDQAPSDFGCSNTATGQYRPLEPLDKFNGGDATGIWTLEIKDNKAGNGGRLDSFKMEICASVEVQSPLQNINRELTLKPMQTALISNAFLKSSDPNGGADQIKYNVVSLPTLGNLLLNNVALKVGDVFTQSDIDGNKISFRSTSSLFPRSDKFSFLVQDSEGGWFGINDFNIKIDDASAVNDPEVLAFIHIFPNPVNDFINIELKDKAADFTLMKLYDSSAKLLLSKKLIGGSNSIDISNFANGQYFIQLADSKNNYITKSIVIIE
jgi:subtilisin-like proprotein convertase family protein